MGDVQWVSPANSQLREALGPMSAPIVCGSLTLIKTQEEGGEKALLSVQTSLTLYVDGVGARLSVGCCVCASAGQGQTGVMVILVLFLT